MSPRGHVREGQALAEAGLGVWGLAVPLPLVALRKQCRGVSPLSTSDKEVFFDLSSGFLKIITDAAHPAMIHYLATP